MEDPRNDIATTGEREAAFDEDDRAPGPGHRRRMLLYFVGFLVLLLVVLRPDSSPAGWGGDFEAALTRARETDRPLVVAFHGAHCPPCQLMDRTVLGKPDVVEALKDFVPVRLDPNANLDLARKYQIAATPTYLVLSPDGTPVHGIIGPQSVEEFVAFLETSLGLAAETSTSQS